MTSGDSDETARVVRAAEMFARAAEQRRRATVAGERARRHEFFAGHDSDGQFHERAAQLQRRNQTRHDATAALHEAYGQRLLGPTDARQALEQAIGEFAGEPGLALHLVSTRGSTLTSLGVDETARACRNLELVLGEGPATDAAACGLTVMDNTDTPGRWARFAPAAREVGVRRVTAVPLSVGGARLGAVAVYSRDPAQRLDLGQLVLPTVATALSTLLIDDGFTWVEVARSDVFAVVHQASGVIANRFGCSVDDALALLRARAFADAIPLDELCASVIADHTLLG